MEVFRLLFGLVAAKRDVKTVGTPHRVYPRTHMRADSSNGCVMLIEHTTKRRRNLI